MGLHSKEPGKRVIDLLSKFGEILGYHVNQEDPMFSGKKTSSQLDITWRKDENAKYPLFIFEIESFPSKSSSDNAIKVFSKNTASYQKPLFFFHVFVEKKHDTGRIDNLNENYDKQNYKAYLLDDNGSKELIMDIIEQHLRIENKVDLYSLLCLMNNTSPIRISLNKFLNIFIEMGYDRKDNTDFLMSLELAIVNGVVQINDFYLSYLESCLVNSNYIHQNYNYLFPGFYSKIIHAGICLLMNESTNEELFFEMLLKIEKNYELHDLWDPYFGLCYDHDFILLSEFPMLLALLSISFKKQEYSMYFNNKCADIFRDIIPKTGHEYLFQHGLVWLIIVSIITKDEIHYNFAKGKLNEFGGIDKEFIIRPTLAVYEDADDRYDVYTNKIKIPEYSHWGEFLNLNLACTEHDILLKGLIEGFLIMDDFEYGRSIFAQYCLYQTIHRTSSHE